MEDNKEPQNSERLELNLDIDHVWITRPDGVRLYINLGFREIGFTSWLNKKKWNKVTKHTYKY